MVGLCSQRLAPWRDRAEVEQSDGSARVPLPSGSFDRFVSTYVLDLLSTDDIALVIEEAHRLLAPGGLVCLVSATHGRTTVERLIIGLATRVHAFSPRLVGGCRAIDLRSFVVPTRWRLVHRNVVSKWGIPSEVLVASRMEG
jgi:ubiquinone/menaquinone biosynthesis C-methylase UbiE